jgi:hypothetical protein
MALCLLSAEVETCVYLHSAYTQIVSVLEVKTSNVFEPIRSLHPFRPGQLALFLLDEWASH